jgi:hypothetical protein
MTRKRENNMPKKVYYRATGVMTLEWVDSPDEATQDTKEAAEATQKHLKDTQHIDAELEEIPPKGHHLPSTWVVCRDIPLPGRSIWGTPSTGRSYGQKQTGARWQRQEWFKEFRRILFCWQEAK